MEDFDLPFPMYLSSCPFLAGLPSHPFPLFMVVLAVDLLVLVDIVVVTGFLEGLFVSVISLGPASCIVASWAMITSSGDILVELGMSIP